jgi:hypothetical protein
MDLGIGGEIACFAHPAQFLKRLAGIIHLLYHTTANDIIKNLIRKREGYGISDHEGTINDDRSMSSRKLAGIQISIA